MSDSKVGRTLPVLTDPSASLANESNVVPATPDGPPRSPSSAEPLQPSRLKASELGPVRRDLEYFLRKDPAGVVLEYLVEPPVPVEIPEDATYWLEYSHSIAERAIQANPALLGALKKLVDDLAIVKTKSSQGRDITAATRKLLEDAEVIANGAGRGLPLIKQFCVAIEGSLRTATNLRRLAALRADGQDV